jgi:hypothetical protein
MMSSNEDRNKPLGEYKPDPSQPPSRRQVGGMHYKSMKIQPITFITENNIPYCEANAIKYLCRHELKNGVQDLDKAIHYIQLLKEMRYGS